MDIKHVPNFMGEDGWVHPFARWLEQYELYPVLFPITNVPEDWHPQGLYIMGGQSSRGSHAVVAQGAKIIFDPHPSREGLVVREDATLLIPFVPRRKCVSLPEPTT